MKLYIVTEGQFDQAVLQTLLKGEPSLEQVQVLAATGSSSAQALARSLLRVKQVPVALVLDADEHEPARVTEYEDYLRAMLEAAAPPNEWKIILFVPEIEATFFQIPGLLASLGLNPTLEQLGKAQVAPKAALDEMIRERSQVPAKQWLQDKFPSLPRDEFWKLKPFAELREFLERFEGTTKAPPVP